MVGLTKLKMGKKMSWIDLAKRQIRYKAVYNSIEKLKRELYALPKESSEILGKAYEIAKDLIEYAYLKTIIKEKIRNVVYDLQSKSLSEKKKNRLIAKLQSLLERKKEFTSRHLAETEEFIKILRSHNDNRRANKIEVLIKQVKANEENSRNTLLAGKYSEIHPLKS
jgi:hypothetical protein